MPGLLPLACLCSFCHTIFFTYVSKFSFANLIWLDSLEWGPCQHSHSQSFLLRLHLCPIHIALPALPLIYYTSTFFGQFLILIIHLIKLHSCPWINQINRCAMTNHWQILKDIMWLVPDYDVHICYLIVIVTYTITHS